MSKRGGCKYPQTCKYMHNIQQPVEPSVDDYCSHFINGSCKFGDKCKKIHPTEAQALQFIKAFSNEIQDYDGEDDEGYYGEEMEDEMAEEMEETKEVPVKKGANNNNNFSSFEQKQVPSRP